jgi:hypothetical protein
MVKYISIRKFCILAILLVAGGMYSCGVTIAADLTSGNVQEFVAGEEIPILRHQPNEINPINVATHTTAKFEAGREISIVRGTPEDSKLLITAVNPNLNISGFQKSSVSLLNVTNTKILPPDQETYGTVSFYSEYYDHAVRWPDGSVSIYDNTGFNRWKLLLERLQPFMGNVVLKMALDEKSADIILDIVYQMPSPH